MKKFTILKGCHYSNFFPSFRLTKNRWKIERVFMFDKSCMYDIDEESCVNKLFGFCFGFGVHKNSVRYGWTYNKEMNEIFIWKYVYKNGKLDKHKIAAVELGTKHGYAFEMNQWVTDKGYGYDVIFKIDGNVVARDEIQSNSWFMTLLGPYFGGNTRAPHKMIVEQV